MAIQTRRGNEVDFDASKMLPGEWAVSLDTKYVRMCFSPGVVYRMATYESFEEDMIQVQQILATCEDIQTAVEAFEALAEQHANDAAASATASANSATESSDRATLSESWAIGNTGERPGENTNNAKYWSEVAQSAANVEIMTPTKLGIGKPDNITIGVNNGTFETKFKNYTSLADLGLTAPKTCLEIATAMPDKAQITLDISSSTTSVTDVPTNRGKLTIESINNWKCYAYFNEFTGVSGIPRMYARHIRPADNIISNWTEYLTTSKLTNNLLATEAGTALDAVQGKALDTRVTTNTNDIDTLTRKLTKVNYNVIPAFNNVSIQISSNNILIHVKAAINFSALSAIEAWAIYKVGSISNWTGTEFDFNLISAYNSEVVRLTIKNNGEIIAIARRNIVAHTQWFCGDTSILI